MSKTMGIPPSIHTARQGGAKRKPGKVSGTITKEPEILIDGQAFQVNNKGRGIHVDWMTRLIRHAQAKVDEFGRALFVRVDLHHPGEMQDNAAITAFMDLMTKRIQGKYGHKMGYAWAREQETAKTPHWHVLLILDYDRISHGKTVRDMVAESWVKRGGSMGQKLQSPYQQVGRGGLPLAGEVSYWISYLCKPRGKGYRPDYVQDFSTGRETTTARSRKQAKIVKVAPVRGAHLLAYVRTRSGMTSEEARELGEVARAGDLWKRWRNVSRVAGHLQVDDRTAARWIAEAAPGALENFKERRRARLDSAKAKAFALVRDGSQVAHAARAVGVDDMTLWYWMERDGELGAAVLEARTEKARKRALGVAMLERGASNAEVREATGAPRTTVVKWRNAAGIAAPVRGASAAGARAQAVELVRQGKTCREVAALVGVHYATVAKWAKATSLTDNNNGGAA